MVDFSEYMSKPIGTMRRTVLPPGHYFGRVAKVEPKESSTKKPMLAVQFKLDSAGEDVPADQLPEQGIQGKTLSVNYMLDTDFGQDDIRKMIEAIVPNVDPAQPWGQYLPQLDGQPVKLYVEQRKRDKDDPNSEMTEDVRKVLSATS